jgi:hypothetical protein
MTRSVRAKRRARFRYVLGGCLDPGVVYKICKESELGDVDFSSRTLFRSSWCDADKGSTEVVKSKEIGPNATISRQLKIYFFEKHSPCHREVQTDRASMFTSCDHKQAVMPSNFVSIPRRTKGSNSLGCGCKYDTIDNRWRFERPESEEVTKMSSANPGQFYNRSSPEKRNDLANVQGRTHPDVKSARL